MQIIKDPALLAGAGQAFDADGKLIATLKLPLKGLVPRGTAVLRLSFRATRPVRPIRLLPC